MAEETAKPIEANQPQDTVVEDMDLVGESAVNGSKRTREEEDEKEKEKEEEGKDDMSKKQKVDLSVEEERLEKHEGEENQCEAKVEDKSVPVSLGPKSFGSSVEMFDYFFKLLHFWPPNLNLNKYEQLMLLDLLKKGHTEPEKKIGVGIQAFQVRYHPMFKSRCFFLIRNDDTMDDFSFRKCVDKILPLPEEMRLKGDGKGKGDGGRGGGGGRGGRGRGRGRGRGPRW
ncbi:protein EMBRYO DEFECTIVE 514 [Euphorbia lathyris]|uniref:protein EMBRYO DEFECTIVE 514 n=1 Tax=Euphorbia lathyris TaxID=212925 RepID=UPI003313699D